MNKGKHTTFQSLPARYWVELDKLESEGWKPLINKLGNRWHVNLEPKGAPVPTVLIDDRGRQFTEESSTIIHGYGTTLSAALDDAFSQLKKEATK